MQPNASSGMLCHKCDNVSYGNQCWVTVFISHATPADAVDSIAWALPTKIQLLRELLVDEVERVRIFSHGADFRTLEPFRPFCVDLQLNRHLTTG